jgi:HlyD family secretion protein
MGDELFRKSALDKLASPERLDVLMQVTSPQGWAALLTIGLVLVAVVAWSIFGSLPERIDGQGELIRGGGTRQITANGDGLLSQLTLNIGDSVQAGQIVGEITGGGVDDAVKGARATYQSRQQEAETAKIEDASNINNLQQGILQDRADITRFQAELGSKEAELTQKNESLQKGLITKARVDQVQQEVDAIKAQISAKQDSVRSRNASISNYQQRMRSRDDQVATARRDAQNAENTKADISQVRSAVVGRVIDVIKRQGDRVHNGEIVATIEPVSVEMEAVVFVDSAVGKRIKPTMEVQISPSTVKREEYGFMKGTVTRVGDYAATPESVNAVLGNQDLTREFLQGGSKFELRVSPTASTTTLSGFSWSSSAGPPEKIGTGTKVTVSVIVDRHPPIVEVLPFLKGVLTKS